MLILSVAIVDLIINDHPAWCKCARKNADVVAMALARGDRLATVSRVGLKRGHV